MQKGCISFSIIFYYNITEEKTNVAVFVWENSVALCANLWLCRSLRYLSTAGLLEE